MGGAPSNHKAFISRPRVARRSQTFTRGTFPAVSLQMARERARAVERAIASGVTDHARLRAIARGGDPNHVARPPDLLETAVAEFITRHLHARRRAPGYIRRVEGRFRNHVLPAFGKRDIRSIARREIVVLLDHVHDSNGPAAANLVLAALRKFFRWARERDLVETVPTEGVTMPGTAIKRERVLDDRELVLIMRAAQRIGYPCGTYAQLLVLTGLRRSEAATLRWADIDLAANTVVWPAERMKSRRAHVVPLAPAVVDLLAHCPRNGPFVLSIDGTKPATSFDWIKHQIDRLAPEIPSWTFHDLRRTCATGMARLGTARFVVARVLAHTDSAITGTYDRYEYLSEKRAALGLWARRVYALLRPQPVEVAHG